MRSVAAVWLLAASFAAQAGAAATPRRAFLTPPTLKGNLSAWAPGGEVGLAAGDAICAAQAAFGSLPDPSAYRAWLSTSTTDAYCHLRGQTGKKGACQGGAPLEAGPWYMANGVTVHSGDLDELTGSGRVIYRSFFRDLDNQDVLEHESYWTGTEPDGTASSSDCNGWTTDAALTFGTLGDALGTATIWTDTGSVPCNETKRLLCLETGPSVPRPWDWSPAMLAFVTSGTGPGDLSSWPDAGGFEGIEAGNAICRAHARRGRLPDPDSFFAWLSTSTDHARDLLQPAGGLIRRPDAIAIETSSAGVVVDGILASLHVDESGRYSSVARRAWTGTFGTGYAADGYLCENWSRSDDAVVGRHGVVASARDDWWTNDGWSGCSTGLALYCFSNTVVLFWDGFDATGDTSRWSDTGP